MRILFRYGWPVCNDGITSQYIILLYSVVCGQRVRVEHAKARSANYRGGPSYGGYRGGEYVEYHLK